MNQYYNPTKQTKFNHKGNCLSACIATLFPVDIDEVPFLNDDSDWTYRLSKWFDYKFGKYVIPVSMGQSQRELLNGSLVITCINSPNPIVDRHAVITKNGRIVFDPMVGEVDLVLTEDQEPEFLIIGMKKSIP